MTDQQKGAIALIVGALGGIVTMALHPTGHQFSDASRFESMERLSVLVHALAIASMPLSFLGTLALTRRLASPDRSATAALVVYAYALIAVMSAAVVSGFVAPGLIREITTTTAPESEMWHIALDYNSRLNQAFAKVFSVGSAVAVFLWSLAIVRTRALAPAVGIAGLLLGPVVVIGIVSGHLRMNVHGEGLIIIAEAIWFIVAGVLLWRADDRCLDAPIGPRVTRTS